MKKILFLLGVMLSLSLQAKSFGPWGKDAELVTPRPPKRVKPCNTTIQEVLIAFHQDIISPADGPRSHFYPSSSEYTLQAMRKYGFYKGFLMGCDRLQRENKEEWVYIKALDGRGDEIKLDPVR